LLLSNGGIPGILPFWPGEVELKKKIIFLALCVVWIAGCAVNRYRSDFEFANKLATEGLWKEAYFRWQKVLAAKGESAALHNNMAVALESLDRAPEAEQEYQLAMKMAPGNPQIQSNYDRFKKNQRKNDNEKK
jgi:tetratricopeptide (TPR) repeat protein